jgi:hypothetical protein
MDDKEAAAILINLLSKKLLNAEETKAVKSAIGILSWISLAKSRLKALKNKKEKSVEWQ